MLEFSNLEHKAILRDFLQKWKVECKADGFVQMRFENISTPRKYCAFGEKVKPGHTKCCTCHAKQTWNLILHNVTPLGNQRPDLLTCLMEMFLVLRWPRHMHLCRSSSRPTPAIIAFETNPHVWLTESIAPATHKMTFERPKLVVTCWCFDHFYCHNGVHFFKHSISKNGVNMWCFYLFYLFCLGNLLRAAGACTFSTAQLPPNLRFNMLTSGCASRRFAARSFDFYPTWWPVFILTRPEISRATELWKNTLYPYPLVI